MKNIQADYIEKLVEIMKNNEITEVTLEDTDTSLVIKSNGFVPVIKEKEQPVIQETITEENMVVEEPINTKKVIPIKSTMIGTFYSKPAPEEKPFVSVGDEIKEDDTICIIETIKLVNKIPSSVSGKVVEICIEDGKPVEYGQVIMYVEEI